MVLIPYKLAAPSQNKYTAYGVDPPSLSAVGSNRNALYPSLITCPIKKSNWKRIDKCFYKYKRSTKGLLFLYCINVQNIIFSSSNSCASKLLSTSYKLDLVSGRMFWIMFILYSYFCKRNEVKRGGAFLSFFGGGAWGGRCAPQDFSQTFLAVRLRSCKK